MFRWPNHHACNSIAGGVALATLYSASSSIMRVLFAQNVNVKQAVTVTYQLHTGKITRSDGSLVYTHLSGDAPVGA